MYGKKITATSQSNNNDGEKSTTGSNKRKTKNTKADTSRNLNSPEHFSQIDKREICVKVDAVYNNVEGDTHVFKGTCRLYPT